MNWLRGQQGAAAGRVSRPRNACEEEVIRVRECQAWRTQLQQSDDYSLWRTAAEQLDELEGHKEWKRSPASPFYDWNLLRERLNQLSQLEAQDDTSGIVAWLRAGMERNFVGTGNAALREASYVGTKDLIEQHHQAVIRALWAMTRSEAIPPEKRLSFLTESRHALGKTALLLSGGAALGMYHFGVVKCLHEEQILPWIVSGSSAGAVVAAMVGTRTHDELTTLFADGGVVKTNLCLQVLASEGGIFERLERVVRKGHIIDMLKLTEALKADLGDITFHEDSEHHSLAAKRLREAPPPQLPHGP
ncbi:hypothetical protein T484DRAFT_3625803 [Baffinella frigidus]|nr:hypothetical protein T484DRAFT_3625803 [Cryptophyta sp. CCMP2293]